MLLEIKIVLTIMTVLLVTAQIITYIETDCWHSDSLTTRVAAITLIIFPILGFEYMIWLWL